MKTNSPSQRSPVIASATPANGRLSVAATLLAVACAGAGDSTVTPRGPAPSQSAFVALNLGFPDRVARAVLATCGYRTERS